MENNVNKKFTNGVIWNYGSILFLAMGGFIFTFLIITFYDAEVLGVFNQAFAYYWVLSQISVCGVHMSVTKYVPEYSENIKVVKDIFVTALCTVFITSILVNGTITLILWCGNIQNDNLEVAVQTFLPALVFFALNKVVLAYLNGLSLMKEYAVFQALRNVFIAAAILVLSLLKTDGNRLSFCLVIAEAVLFIIGIIFLFLTKRLNGNLTMKWVYKNLGFGIRILPANMVLELNTKIDIICLGIAGEGDWQIGIYSFAVLFTEGFYQVFVVLRRSLNPYIAQLSSGGTSVNQFKELYCRVEKFLRRASFSLMLLLVLGFFAICLVLGKGEYWNGLMPLIIISVSIAINSKSIVLGNFLSQSGFPTQESMINCITISSNFFLNIILIHFWGMNGAAIATATSYLIFSISLKSFMKKKLLYRI